MAPQRISSGLRIPTLKKPTLNIHPSGVTKTVFDINPPGVKKPTLTINPSGLLQISLKRSLRNNPLVKDLSFDDDSQNPYQLMNERLNSAKIKEVEEGTALRVRLFVSAYNCDKWDINGKTTTFLGGLPSVDYFGETHCQVIYQLKNSKFIGYASVVVMVHRYSLLLSIMEAMEGNKYLRYKSKLVLCRYNHNFAYGTNMPFVFDSAQQRNEISNIYAELKKVDVYISKASAISVNLRGKEKGSLDSEMDENRQIDNLILVQWFDDDSFKGRYGYALMLYAILMQPFTSFRETVLVTFQGSFLAATSNSDLYAYCINPALAIIINNYYFTNQRQARAGSERDVINLIRELKIAGIPYILVEDCDTQDLQQIIDYIATKDFRPLKSFLFFLMSHGDSDDVVYTCDGELNIQTDIVNRIQGNASLERAKKLLAFIGCRGDIDMDYADDKELERITPTDASNLSNNTMVLYSVPKEVQSIRDRETGCPFIQSFCQHFRNISHTEDVREVDRKIDKDLKQLDYFDELEKCTEVLVGDDEELYNIIQEPVNIEEVLQMLNSITHEFPKQETNNPKGPAGGSSFLCGVFNTTKFEKEDLIRKYFAAELESDTFSVMEE